MAEKGIRFRCKDREIDSRSFCFCLTPGKEYLTKRDLDQEDEIGYPKAVMGDNGIDSPEEFDLWLSQRGF